MKRILILITTPLQVTAASSVFVSSSTKFKHHNNKIPPPPPLFLIVPQSFTNQFIAFLEKESMPNAPLKLPTELNATSHQDSRLRKVISSSLPPDQQLPRQMASSPYRHPPTDNPLFSHLPQQQSTVSSTGDTTSMVTWAPSLAGSSRESTASEPEMLRELLGQAPSSSLS